MTGPTDPDALIATPLRGSGVVDQPALDRARSWGHEHRVSLAEALLRLELVREVDFLKVFAELYATRYVKAEKLKGLELDPALLERVGVRAAERLKACPLRWDPETQALHLVAAVPLSATLEPELRQVVGARSVTVYVATPAAVAALIHRAYHHQPDAFAQVTANGAGPALQRAPERAPDTTPLVGREDLRTPTEAPSALARRLAAVADAPVSDTLPMDGPPGTGSLEAVTIATLRRENARYRIAQEFHRRVSLERDVETMAHRILEVIFELLPADGAALWLTGGQFHSRTKDGGAGVEVPRAVIDQALASSAGLLAHNALVDRRFGRSQTVMARGVKSVMAVPLRTRAGTLGILYVESLSLSAAFTEEDLPLLDSLAAQASLLLDNAALVARVEKEVEARVGLARFLSRAAVEEVLSGRLEVNLQGQRSELTVLFADIRGFTALSAQLGPEEVVRFLNAFFSEAAEAVERHGGIVDKLIGDCVMALWGAVRPQASDARQALQAALELVERAGRIVVAGVPLRLGVGLNSGPAVVGAVGGTKRLDYTAVGPTVNLAARLCSLAGAGEVLVTARTLELAGPGVAHEAREPATLKGLEAPIVPYRVRAVQAPLQLGQVARGAPGGGAAHRG